MNKKPFVFISDFDGTITKRDFYWHMIDKYMPIEGIQWYQQWKKGEFLDIEFLSKVFNSINQTETQIIEDILQIPIDPTLLPFIQYIKNHGGDFIIVSAGTSYYIDILLEFHGIHNDVILFSNPGFYKEKGLYFNLDPENPFYSSRYGIDKKKVVEALSEQYNVLYYAGDSEPDYQASLLCNTRFAKGPLIEIYEENQIDFYPFTHFSEIQSFICFGQTHSLNFLDKIR